MIKIFRPTDLIDNAIDADCLQPGTPEKKAVWRINVPYCSIKIKDNKIIAIRINKIDFVPCEMPDFDSYFQAEGCDFYDREYQIRNLRFRFWPAAFVFDVKGRLGWECGLEFHANEYCRGVNGKILRGYTNYLNTRYID